MKKSELEQLIKEEIAKCISEILAKHVVNESIHKIKVNKRKKRK